jgi:hypothetical protein
MKLDRPKTNPESYITFGGNKNKKLSYGEQYYLPAKNQETPWVTSRFGPQDLTKRVANRKLNLNDLNFLPEGEEVIGYEMFPGRGRFAPETEYDYEIGRPATENYPEQQPDFNPIWNQSYLSSPVMPPSDKVQNPFPRQANNDPNGYLQEMIEQGLTTEISAFPDLIRENPQTSLSV